MKKLILIVLLIFTFALISFSLKDDDPENYTLNSPDQFLGIDFQKFDGNNISTWYRTNGSFNRDPSSGDAGFEWPKGSRKYARYVSGLWIGCISGNDTLTAIADFSYDFQAGFVDNNGNPQGANDSNYRIYKISKGDFTSNDYLNWPVNQGAYVTVDGKPYLMGIQSMFYVYTDAYPHNSGQTSVRSLKAQILQTNWAYNPFESYHDSSVPLSNTIFTEYKIINRSNETWNSTWIAIWTNDGLGSPSDDKVGCDTNLNLQFTYNAISSDPAYGSAPPAAGVKFLQSGLRYTGNLNDTVKYYSPFGSNNLIRKIGYKDLGMTVFNYYNNSSPEPASARNNTETYRVLKGLQRLGTEWTNPVTGNLTTKTYSGDPVAGTGWIMQGANERRWNASTGPVTVSPGDTVIIITAQIIARSTSNINSITALKRTAQLAQSFYNNNLAPQSIPPSPIVSSHAPGNGKIYLSWNDSLEKISFPNSLSGGIYKFQGYNIYQIKTYPGSLSSIDTILLKTFDIKDGIKNILDSVFIDQYQGIAYGLVQKGSDNGISRFIVLDKDIISNRDFIMGTEYKFAVTAYYYDPLGGVFSYPKVNESPKSRSIISVVPQSLTPGTQVSYQAGDTIYTDQTDLGVMPIVFDPLKLTSASYTSTFGQIGNELTWTLTKTANAITSVLFENVADFSGLQSNGKIVDGLLLVHQAVSDSGIIRDPEDFLLKYFSNTTQLIKQYKNRERAWKYDPPGKEWFTAPDTNAIKSSNIFSGRQFHSRSLGMSFPTQETFTGRSTRIFATGKFLQPGTGSNTLLRGGPLRKIQFVFGQRSMAYRYVPTDTNFINIPYADMVSIPFSVFAVDELDSSRGIPRQLNIGFADKDNDGQWNPDTSKLGNQHYTYILASDYNPVPNVLYTSKDPGQPNGFSTMDMMYIWLPRVKKSETGVPLTFSYGDRLIVSPYRISRPEFVPGYPVKYSWSVKGTEAGNQGVASAQIKDINVFPNPYYGFSELEYNSSGDKFIYFSHLPLMCKIFIYTLDGILVKKVERNQTDPTNTLEKWDLKNSEGRDVASGMYVVYVDCGELGSKTMKMAVFTRK